MASPAASKTEQPTSQKGFEVRVLVIDDDQDVCDYLVMLLEREGYEATALTNPRDAAGVLRKGEFHLVILDLMMPGMDGTEVLKEIRRIDDDVAVIIFTGYPSMDTAITSLQHQASDYLKKPFRVEEFRDAVQRALESKGLVLDPEGALHRSIGTTIRNLRKERNLTLKQLSRRTALSVSLLSQIERAESSASVSSLHKIARALRVKLTTLFGDF
ncbi:MAG: response regulator [Deltaproteobacteria bacterium]|nr:response regulator [Deltaproteobacteria bacterium]